MFNVISNQINENKNTYPNDKVSRVAKIQCWPGCGKTSHALLGMGSCKTFGEDGLTCNKMSTQFNPVIRLLQGWLTQLC